MACTGRCHVGTSGWIYRHWRGVIYPPRFPARDWFAHYARLFNTVEINNTFYRLPSPAVFADWQRQAPPGFLYAVKVSRFLAHCKKLNDPEEPLAHVLAGARLLGRRLGPVLYQLPPHWRRNVERLRRFLRLLPAGIDHVFEFRDPSRYDESVRAALAEFAASFCIHDLGGQVSPRWVTGPIVYWRFRGPTATAYAGRYGRARSPIRWASSVNRGLTYLRTSTTTRRETPSPTPATCRNCLGFKLLPRWRGRIGRRH